jgi:phosphatidate cytidylyltransferase
MLRWRLLVGTALTLLLAAMGWLDHAAAGPVPGIWLVPAVVFFAGLGTRELLGLLAAAGIRPLAWTVYVGNLLVLASPWGPWLRGWLAGERGLAGAAVAASGDASGSWVVLAFAAAVVLALLGEMQRYKQPGRSTANLGGAVLAIGYVGVLLSFAVRLRLAWGIGALASLVIVAKCADSGAYFVGRLMGRHPMSPVLSPKKTIEGAVGAVLLALATSWATFTWLVPATAAAPQAGQACAWHGWGWAAFGLAIGVAGIAGDLAESLLKRDAGAKDSGGWLPGLGGALDLMDSVLLGAPVAWASWAFAVAGI